MIDPRQSRRPVLIAGAVITAAGLALFTARSGASSYSSDAV